MTPTEPGYYWAYDSEVYVNPVIVRVEWTQGAEKNLAVSKFGHTQKFPLSQFVDWEGPLTKETK